MSLISFAQGMREAERVTSSSRARLARATLCNVLHIPASTWAHMRRAVDRRYGPGRPHHLHSDSKYAGKKQESGGKVTHGGLR